MNHQSQRIAIAEHCGIKSFPKHEWEERDDRRYFICTRCDETIGWGDYSKDKGVFQDACSGTEKDYPNDLNAMRDAENELSQEQWQLYYTNLVRILTTPSYCWWDIMTATAQQRAEAFLKTIGKWKEELIDLNTQS